MSGIRSFLSELLSGLLIAAVRLYQFAVSPVIAAIFGTACRFTPSCSQYFILAVRKYGPFVGAAKGIGRVCRCHPWHPGGYDPP